MSIYYNTVSEVQNKLKVNLLYKNEYIFTSMQLI